MVAPVPPTGSLVRTLGRNHARLGMEPRHPGVVDYMEGYKEYSLTTKPETIKIPSQPKQRG